MTQTDADRITERRRDLLARDRFSVILVAFAVLVLLAIFTFAGCTPPPEVAQEQRAREVARRHHSASPESWAACRAICGEHAALLPAGDGSWWVVCSCLPPGTTVAGAR